MKDLQKVYARFSCISASTGDSSVKNEIVIDTRCGNTTVFARTERVDVRDFKTRNTIKYKVNTHLVMERRLYSLCERLNARASILDRP